MKPYKVTTIEIDGGPFIVPDDNRMPMFRVCRDPYYVGNSAWEHRLADKVVDVAAPVFVDVGANFGYYSFLAARRGSIVHAFEPNHFNFEILTRNVGEMANCYPIALGDSIDIYTLNVSHRNHGGHSLTLNGNERGYRKEQAQPTITLPLDRLDFQPAAIKIDVEGAGYLVIKGARETIKKTCYWVFVELHNREEREKIPKYLYDLGFDITYPEPKREGLFAQRTRIN